MRCTVCGCDILPNSICCQNCGTRVIEMTGVNSAQPRYGNSFNNSFNNGFDNGLNSNVRAVRKNMSIGKKVLILLLALFVGAAIGFGYWYYHNVSTHTIREENFSVELPRSLEKATTIDYAAQSSDGTVKANGKYADVNSDFQYMILDYSSLAGETTDILTEKLFVTYMKGNLKSQFGSSYKEVYASGNKLKMTYRAKRATKFITMLYAKSQVINIIGLFLAVRLMKRISMTRNLKSGQAQSISINTKFIKSIC